MTVMTNYDDGDDEGNADGDTDDGDEEHPSG